MLIVDPEKRPSISDVLDFLKGNYKSKNKSNDNGKIFFKIF